METLLSLMRESYEGDADIWLAVNAGLRDGLVRAAARRCPYYAEIGGATDSFEGLPLLTKQTVRDRYEDLIARGLPHERRVEKVTSGSTGDPLVFLKDLWFGTAETAACVFLKMMHGIPLDAVQVLLTGLSVDEPQVDEMGIPLPGPNGQPPIVRVPAGSLTSRTISDHLSAWAAFGPYWIYGTASVIEGLAGEICELRPAIPNPPVACVTTGDNSTSNGLERVRQAFGCPVHSWYGSSELSGYAAGTVPDSPGDSYAFNPFVSYVEVTDEVGRPLPPGEPGHLVMTDLHNHVMPFIRYDTGDRAAMAGCSIGGFPVATGLEGRTQTERIRLQSGRVLTAASLGYVFQDERVASAVRGWQCAQTGTNAIEFHVVAGRTGQALDVEIVDLLQQRARSALDADTRVEVRLVTRLSTLPSGKRWLVRGQ
jgi:phenylacetate-CoA ligase